MAMNILIPPESPDSANLFCERQVTSGQSLRVLPQVADHVCLLLHHLVNVVLVPGKSYMKYSWDKGHSFIGEADNWK